jgi:hypothetical protein
MPDNHFPPSEEAALIAKLAGSKASVAGENGGEFDLLRYPVDDGEVFRLFGRVTTPGLQPETPRTAAAVRGRISDLLLNRPVTGSNAETARGNSRWKHAKSADHQPAGDKKAYSGTGAAMAFVPNEDDVANAVEGFKHRNIRTLHICAWAAAVGVLATWYIFWMW